MPVTLPEIVRQLSSLPPKRVAEVYDFVLFLKTRPDEPQDESDEWSEQDQRDAATASLHYAEAILTMMEDSDDKIR